MLRDTGREAISSGGQSARVRLTFDWDDQLRNDWEDFLAAPPGQQVINALQENTRAQS